MKPFYVTTPIYYLNAAPHLGHAYTTVAADAIARWHRLAGRDAHFLTGTDEHGQKVYEAAQNRGITPQQHVDATAVPFRDLWERFDIANDDFIRTTEPRHTRVVQAVLQALYEKGDLYTADYEGWYSTAEERFWTEKDLVDGRCPVSGQPVEWIKEKNWFFRMSEYGDRLRAWMAEHPDFVQPTSRRNEVLGYLRQEMGDLCISRPKSRLSWGIPLPFDPEYVTYVWFDALLNYVSAIGYRSDDSAKSARFEQLWPADVQLVGKDILTTHAVYWSTMLFALGLTPARRLYAHGWWTIEGRKMSKSTGNVVDPNLLIDCYGSDAVRYFLLRELPFGGDGDFSHDAFMTRFNADLANDLGNLAHRSLSMTEKWLGGVVPELDGPTEADATLDALAASTVDAVREQYEALQFSRALEALWVLVRAGNKYLDSEQPWRLNREGNTARLAGVMRRALEICRVAAVLLSPVCPTKASELARKLGQSGTHGANDLAAARSLAGLEAGHAVASGEPLFPRMQALPDRIVAVRQRALGEDEAASTPATGKGAAADADADAKASRAGKGKAETADADSEPDDVAPITIADFARVHLRAGKVVEAAKHPKANRLLVLTVDLGEPEARTIVAGLADRYAPEALVGQQVVVVANLKPAKLRGVKSQGMVLAVGDASVESLVTLADPVAPGSVVR